MSDQKNENKPILLPDEKALLLDHDYDGIHELDHPLPRWWLAIFYLTIVFSVFYVGYYMTGIGPDLRQELDHELADLEAKRPKTPPRPEKEAGTDSVFLAAIKDVAKVADGKEVFAGKCAACHGQSAEGGIGPNLTDKHWIHGKGRLEDIAATVRDGVAEKGMPPWGAILKDDELIKVVAFIRSVRGTNPPGAKEPQGGEFEPDEL